MSQSMYPAHFVLELLPQPAFFLEGEEITWCNAACRALTLGCGEMVPALMPPAPLPQGDTVLHWEAAFFGHFWEVTVRCLAGQHLFLLQKTEELSQDGSVMLAAARSIQPPLEELISSGARLFPRLEELEDESIQEKTAAITQASFRLMRAMNNLSAYDRLNREQGLLQLEKCDIKAFFQELAEKAAGILRDGGIQLRYSGPKKPVYGTLDRQEVTRAVLNLLSNAAGCSGKAAPIVMKTLAENGKARITVTSATTMPEDILVTAFTRYREPVGPATQQGAGLGLAVVQAVARRHGGNVLLESRKGYTQVTLILDVSRPLTELNTPVVDFTGGYDPILVEFSGILPASTFDSRNVDL